MITASPYASVVVYNGQWPKVNWLGTWKSTVVSVLPNAIGIFVLAAAIAILTREQKKIP